ncbi:MAG: putative deoxyribonuclease YcfH [candidate division WS6 bacterium OLB20]|uniref:Putative deoxyribonuclease YcfH n=1 Tax=candidate division WS6 bacterium OLB20 TaxID=1617426 RepID=A0A136LZ10_9BACT|nr:MAG: putative deoxyribonuclease YcfH [candidate division WS6 bacterium OLB20]
MNLFASLIEAGTLFDSHCHLTDPWFSDRLDETLAAAAAAGVTSVINVATGGGDAVAMQHLFKGRAVSPTAGFHPEITIPGSKMHEEVGSGWLDQCRDRLDEALKGNLVMIGECGMDLYWPRKNNLPDDEIRAIRNRQEELLYMQCELAQLHNLPLTLHTRDALAETLAVVNRFDVTAVFHSFTGTYEELAAIMEHGYYIGINGIITYPSAQNLREAVDRYLGSRIESAADLYQRRVLIETDSPYLAPQIHRGERNQPAFAAEIFAFVRDLSISGI